MQRLRELDFLRGIAILLVLLNHHYVSTWTTNMGWIGVDLFFVLSGYLVSRLLFLEYLAFGRIDPIKFLIRRGFKIYPIYYLFLLPYFWIKYKEGPLNFVGLVSDLVFVQNYTWGYGYGYAASWSLAVEEHFYFLMAFSLPLYLYLKNRFKDFFKKYLPPLDCFVGFILAMVLAARFYINGQMPAKVIYYTMTHLRIDSLLAGVLISYWDTFKDQKLIEFQKRYQKIGLWIACSIPLAFGAVKCLDSYWIRTFGFSVLWLCFSFTLICFIKDERINEKLDRILGKWIVNLTAKIGFCSYSIYVIHTLVNLLVPDWGIPNWASFILTSVLSCGIGYVMTHYIERYFLSLRNRFFPARKG